MKQKQDHNGGSLHSDLELLKTNDGSPTLRSARFNATYHSLHGAFQESEHVFLKAGLADFIQRFPRSEVSIFEMGFGTGLNAYLTQALTSRSLHIDYQAIEMFPIDERHRRALLDHLRSMGGGAEVFQMLHDAPWDSSCMISPFFQLKKYEGDILEFTLESPVDIIFYDAFGPGTQPELWDERMTDKFFSFLKDPGCLVTYSAQGAFRRALVSSGFRVEKLKGPPGKRDMTRAWKEGPKESV